MKKVRVPTAALVGLLVLAAPSLVGGCSGFRETPQPDYHDRSARLDRDDFREAFNKPRQPPPRAEEPPIPEMQPLVAMPSLDLPANARLVTLSVNELVPLRDLLIELARQADVDLELDPNIEGSIIFSAKNRPFEDVVARIADVSGLRYSLAGNVLRIEADEPYLRTYRVDYLNIIRRTSSEVSTQVEVAGGEGGAATGNVSSSAVEGESVADFWSELSTGLAQILANTDRAKTLKAPEAAPAVRSGAAAADAGEGGGADTQPAEPVAVQAEEEDEPQITATEASNLFSINRQAGVITVYATQRQHTYIEDYLATLRRNSVRQVLIEAKVLEVTLNDEFQSGINWASSFGGDFNLAAPLGTVVTPPPFPDTLTATADLITLALDSSDLDVVFNFVQQFGTVRTLSSPRLTVLHNHTAVLKVATNRVYFDIDVEREFVGINDREILNVDSTALTVPEGLIMTVQPTINAETEEVTLSLRPTVTRVAQFVSDPGVAFQSNNQVQSLVPELAVQELDSVVTMSSGQVVIMGGLMRDDSRNTESGVPGLSEIPYIGHAFKSRDEQINKQELVIFLRATIVDRPMIPEADVDFYRKFSGDRRPLPM